MLSQTNSRSSVRRNCLSGAIGRSTNSIRRIRGFSRWHASTDYRPVRGPPTSRVARRRVTHRERRFHRLDARRRCPGDEHCLDFDFGEEYPGRQLAVNRATSQRCIAALIPENTGQHRSATRCWRIARRSTGSLSGRQLGNFPVRDCGVRGNGTDTLRAGSTGAAVTGNNVAVSVAYSASSSPPTTSRERMYAARMTLRSDDSSRSCRSF